MSYSDDFYRRLRRDRQRLEGLWVYRAPAGMSLAEILADAQRRIEAKNKRVWDEDEMLESVGLRCE